MVPIDVPCALLELDVDADIIEQVLQVPGVVWQIGLEVRELVHHRGHDERGHSREHAEDPQEDQKDRERPRQAFPHHPLDVGEKRGVEDESGQYEQDDRPELR